MKNLAFTITLFSLLVSCSSVNKTGHEPTDAVLEHMSKEERIIGNHWEDRFTRDGFVNGEYVAIGTATSKDVNANYIPLKSHAESMAVANLLKSAPSDFKRVIQRVLNTLDGNEGSTTEDQVMITEVKALTGLKSNFKDFQCIKKAKPNKSLEWDFEKECRVLVRIPASKLLEAYNFTLAQKYDIQKENKLKGLLRTELSSRSVASGH